jgi:hypothetical protein
MKNHNNQCLSASKRLLRQPQNIGKSAKQRFLSAVKYEMSKFMIAHISPFLHLPIETT